MILFELELENVGFHIQCFLKNH